MLGQPYLSLQAQASVQYEGISRFRSREITPDACYERQVEHPVLAVGEQRCQVAEVIGAQVHVELPFCPARVVVQKCRAASCGNPDTVNAVLPEPFPQCELRVHQYIPRISGSRRYRDETVAPQHGPAAADPRRLVVMPIIAEAATS